MNENKCNICITMSLGDYNFNEYFEKLQNHVLHTSTNYVYTELCTACGSYAFNYRYSTQVFTLSTCFLVNKGK